MKIASLLQAFHDPVDAFHIAFRKKVFERLRKIRGSKHERSMINVAMHLGRGYADRIKDSGDRGDNG
jgi:hypothetical protein